MLKAYVVDDERLAVQRLRRLLDATGRVEVVGSTTDPEAAIAFLRANRVDVLFLDVQMPGVTGFELLERIGGDPLVVFVTAFDQYALDAFAVNSVDYLLKPVDAERLNRALDRLEKRDVRALAQALAAHLKGAGTGALARVASRVGERTTVLEVARVSHFFSQDKLTFAVLDGREHVVEHTLAELEARLDPRRFVRIHRATIVNVSFVQELRPGAETAGRRGPEGGGDARAGLVVRLKDSKATELSVARDRVRELKSRLGI